MKTTFKTFAVSFRVKKYRAGFIFVEIHLARNSDHFSKVYPTRKKAEAGMQWYSRKHYGEKAA